jgi:hypothetical protein
MRVQLWVIAGLLLLSGCAGKESAAGATKLQAWLDRQHYSSWETFCGPNHQIPRKPDGFTLGSRHIFAGIGCDPKDLSQIEPLFGSRKSIRALPSPLLFALQRGGETTPLSQFDQQRLRRVSHSGIIVGTSKSGGAEVTLVDFAPTAPESNCLVRLVIVKNLGERARFSLIFSGIFAELTALDSKTLLINSRLGIASDHDLRTRPAESRSEISLTLGYIGKGQSRSGVIVFVPAKYRPQVLQDLKPAKKLLADPVRALENTRLEWAAWRRRIKTPGGDSRREELIDSLLCLVRSHIGFTAIHTGSLHYAHTRAWVRDNYWVARALLEVGLKKEAKLNLDFFFSAWQKSGLASYYDIAGRRGFAYGDMQVELPHYPVLMVRDAEQKGGIAARPYWPMVKDCLNRGRLDPNGLQPVNGDESWLLAANIDPLDYVLDNSLLFIAAREYGADLARRMGEVKAAEKYAGEAKHARQALEHWLIDPRHHRFAAAASGEPDNRQIDEYPLTGSFARPIVLGLYAADDPRLRAGLLACWEDLNYPEGVRAYSRSDIIDGGTPGYLLYAASEAGLGFAPELEKRVIQGFCSATGCVWELQSGTDPVWGGEKRRLWDSAVLLMALLHRSKASPKSSLLPAASASGTSLRLPLPASPEQLVILENHSPAPARELATQLARYYGAPLAVKSWSGGFPETGDCIFISPTPPSRLPATSGKLPPAGDNYTWLSLAGLSPRGQNIIWVKNTGKVFADLRGVEYDLFRSALPRRQPAPYPKSDLDLAGRIGEKPAGILPVAVVCSQPLTIACGAKREKTAQGNFFLDLAAPAAAQNSQKIPGKGDRQNPAINNLKISATVEDEKIVALSVGASALPGAATTARVAITFPAGWWLLEASRLQSSWNRLTDPIDEVPRPDGSRTFVFRITLSPGGGGAAILRLARPAIGPLPPAPAPPPQQYRRRLPMPRE